MARLSEIGFLWLLRGDQVTIDFSGVWEHGLQGMGGIGDVVG